jgi:hypothetical protein
MVSIHLLSGPAGVFQASAGVQAGVGAGRGRRGVDITFPAGAGCGEQAKHLQKKVA